MSTQSDASDSEPASAIPKTGPFGRLPSPETRQTREHLRMARGIKAPLIWQLVSRALRVSLLSPRRSGMIDFSENQQRQF
jgi:hypothetical protein